MTGTTSSIPTPARAGNPPTTVVLAAYGAVGVALASLAGFLAGLAGRAGLPEVVQYAGAAGALVELGLARALLRRSRAAWAFLLAVEAVVTLVSLFVVPQLLRGGPLAWVGVVFAAVHLLLTILLVLAAPEFGGEGD